MLASVSGPLKQLLHLDYTELTSATNASFLLGTTCEKQQMWRIAKPDSPENVQGSLVKRAYSKAKVTKPSSPKFKQQLMAWTMGQTMLFNTTINLTSPPRPFWRSTASCHFHQHHSLRNTIIISAITRLTMQWFVVTSLYSRSISHNFNINWLLVSLSRETFSQRMDSHLQTKSHSAWRDKTHTFLYWDTSATEYWSPTYRVAILGTLQYMDQDSLNGALVFNKWPPLWNARRVGFGVLIHVCERANLRAECTHTHNLVRSCQKRQQSQAKPDTVLSHSKLFIPRRPYSASADSSKISCIQVRSIQNAQFITEIIFFSFNSFLQNKAEKEAL